MCHRLEGGGLNPGAQLFDKDSTEFACYRVSIVLKVLPMAEPTRPLTAKEACSRAGKARLTSMTAEERKRIAKLAAAARWGKKADAPDPTTPPPNGPERDRQCAEAGIMYSARRPARSTGSERLRGRSLAATA
jgi:hypothetical protein